MPVAGADRGIVYVLETEGVADAVKIGRTTRLQERLRDITFYRGRVTFLHIRQVDEHGLVETRAHRVLREFQRQESYLREWFSVPRDEAIEVVRQAEDWVQTAKRSYVFWDRSAQRPRTVKMTPAEYRALTAHAAD